MVAEAANPKSKQTILKAAKARREEQLKHQHAAAAKDGSSGAGQAAASTAEGVSHVAG